MIAFWAAAGVFSAVAAIIVLLRAAQAARTEPADTTSVFYRRQMAEIGELAERGLLGAEERSSAEAEAGRRLLNAADEPALAWSETGTPRGALVAAVVAAPVLALALYMIVGAPGMADQPFAARLKNWTANPQSLTPPQMAAVLSKMTRERPGEPDVFRFLALAERASDNPPGAVRALRRAVKLAPQRADLWEMLGEAQMMQAGGEVNDDAREAFTQALTFDPTSVGARFYLARAEVTGGDPAKGVAMWRELLTEMQPEDPRRAAVLGAISEAENAPPPPPAFSGDQMAAIRGMVAGLAERLKTKPDDPEGWVRLVRAYSVLGETDKRNAALTQARTRYANKANVLDRLNQATKVEPMR